MKERQADDALDALIDRVAGEMTAGTPGAGFAARVKARIESQGAGSWVRGLAWATGSLAVAGLVLALVLPWRGSDVGPAPEQHDAQSSVGRALPPDAAGTPPRIEQDPDRSDRSPRGDVGRVARRREPARIPVPEDAPQLAALGDIAPLVVDVNAPASLTVAPLELPDLAVVPLDPDRVDKEPR